jgi:RNA polymerase sigma-70 factor, ECF subfamily
LENDQPARESANVDAEPVGWFVENFYAELRRMARRASGNERDGHTLQPTALIHELYVRLAANRANDWQGRTHFLAVAATNLRRILIDHARAARAERRGGARERVPLDMANPSVSCSYDELLIIDEALNLLQAVEPRAARVTELRFFAGLLEVEIAEELGVSVVTVKRDWKFARAWLAAHLARDGA